MIKKLGISLASLHFFSVVIAAAFIATSTDKNAVMLWLYYLIIDFPIAFLLVPASYLMDLINPISPIDALGNYSVYRDIDNFWFPAVFIGIVGTVWWYYLPRLITNTVMYVVGLFKGRLTRSE